MAPDADHELGAVPAQPYELRNWILCSLILITYVAGALWWLFAKEGDYRCNPKAAEVPALCFDIAAALYFTVVLALSYLEPRPLVVDYAVVGRPDIPSCRRSFRGMGRWIAFTLWSNTLGTLYYWVAAAVGMLVRSGQNVPRPLCVAQEVLWEITLPMAFLINIVVTAVLIPMMNKQGKFETLFWMTRWKSLSLHNGFCIAAAIECGLAAPRAVLDHLPIMMLYGSAYVIFAWGLWCMTGVYLYFFLDPRFRPAPLGLLALQALLAALYFLGSSATAAALGPWPWTARAGVLVLALATCTWRHRNAVDPSVRST